MNKKVLLTAMGLSLVAYLFFLGSTVQKKTGPNFNTAQLPSAPSFNISQYLVQAKLPLNPWQNNKLDKLENAIANSNVLSQKIAAYNNIANFWKDSIHLPEPYFYYLSLAAKLENSEKNLTFAAQLILENLKAEQDEAKLNWKADEGIALFEQALKLNSDNADLKIGLGSCYIYGKGRNGKPNEIMNGIQQLLSVVRKDSTNLKAQLVLGVGGFVSGQYDKAIERLSKVINAQPHNAEAIAYLADTYASKGDKANAIKWYKALKLAVNNPDYNIEIDKRIELLK